MEKKEDEKGFKGFCKKSVNYIVEHSVYLLFIAVIVWVGLYFKIKYNVGNQNNILGPIGDGVGGFFGPLIGFFSALLVYKSFQEQKEANRLLGLQVNIDHSFMFLEKIDKLLDQIRVINDEFYSKLDHDEDNGPSFASYVRTTMIHYENEFDGREIAFENIQTIHQWQRDTLGILIDLEQYCKLIWSLQNNESPKTLLKARLIFAKPELFRMQKDTNTLNIILEKTELPNKYKERLKQFNKISLSYYEGEKFKSVNTILKKDN